MKIDVQTVIDYISAKKNFPHEFLQKYGSDCVLAGGSVANAILAITYDRDYPVNDLDLFRWSKAHVLRSGQEKIVVVEPRLREGYPDVLSNMVRIVGRYTEYDLDIIDMGVTDKTSGYTNDKAFFPGAVLNSFDLNCVGAGIYYTQDEYHLITTPEFDKFVVTQQVEITNVHSKVTLLRAMKKAHDLGAYVNVREEVVLIHTVTSPALLNNLTEDQRNKHAAFLEEYDSVADVFNKEERLLQFMYEFFGNHRKINRPVKISWVRAFLRGNARRKALIKDIVSFLNRSPDDSLMPTIVMLAYIGGESWLDGKMLSAEHLLSVLTFAENHVNLLKYYYNLDFDSFVARVDYIKAIQREHPTIIGVMENYYLTEEVADTIASEWVFQGVVAACIRQAEEDEKRLREPLFNLDYKIPTMTIDGVTFEEMSTGMDLSVLGTLQHHCVGGYGDSVRNGRSRIIKVSNGNLISTMELNVDHIRRRFSIVQHRTYNNASVDDIGVRKAVEEFIIKLNADGSRYIFGKMEPSYPF